MSCVPFGTELVINGDFPRTQPAAFPSKNLKKPGRTRTRKRTTKKTFSSRNASGNPPIIVHCHLCWDWVWQRPQQFISRLSQRHKILFVETLGPDPHLSAPLARFHVPEQFPNVTVLRIQFPTWRWNDGAFVDGERRRL